ncbi:MAG: hypothetical protein H0W83_15360, partial [Planctomycetes bacterium]|nr:hypothetical protein [Planctomycetota bacterium]
LGWIKPEVVTAIRRLIKEDKRRVKLEEGLIALWQNSGFEAQATMRAADRFGHDLDDVDQALRRMRRYRDDSGNTQLDYTGKSGVETMLDVLRHDADPELREAALSLHLQLDLTRPGKPSRMVFNHIEFDFHPPGSVKGTAPVRALLMGTEHEVTPSYLRKHKRDLSLTCYDAFHNTLLDALDTGKVRNWHELTSHLIKANTDVRILGSLGLDDYLGHCVLMSQDMAKRTKSLGGSRTWADTGSDPKLGILRDMKVLIDPQYEEIYGLILDAADHGIKFESGPKDIETTCATQDRVAIYIVRSGSTVACTPGLCVVGEELIISETIVAVNQERLDHNRNIGKLVESLAPTQADHAPAWRAKLAAKLGDRLV